MKKIMFNDQYGLTKAVLVGRKTMTRRLAPVKWAAGEWHDNPEPYYKIGEVLAIAQRYSELSWDKRFYDNLCSMCDRLPQYELKGWDNKMFVRADLMPHRIKITDVKIERLQDITESDCRREGITTKTEGKYEVGNGFGWDTTCDALERDTFFSLRAAFAALINKVSGHGTWERNPWVFAYSFQLLY
jgi:hypothetical protein